MKKNPDQFTGWLTIALCLLISLAVLSCSDPVLFPDNLIGMWVTDTEQYEDRYIEIDKTRIILGTGETVPNIFFVNRVESEPFGEKTEWIFHCEIKKGESYTISFLFPADPDSGEGIQLKNSPQIVWYKEDR
ncbi:MAG: hypothetical protein KKE62_02600 [Proteobacteria bacterium]|nr:hypothetical protein [Pseudomonadota bacterium]MBU1387428.1 hypothetical protein [Pseudomonadota bacterium]MBU1541713.1 hypothetical protein [Pseudomonadota bacterium]MBU2431335.1 hypothetical protein [Pseudomonadota bacterium]MBU2481984.1 hypothetical protein [Pseudomonadota bacterium]